MSIVAPSTLLTHPLHAVSVVRALLVDKDCGNMVVCMQVRDLQGGPHSYASVVENALQVGRVTLFTPVPILGNVLMVVASVGRLFVMGEPFVNMNVFTQVNVLMCVPFVLEHLIKRWCYVNMYAGYMRHETWMAASCVVMWLQTGRLSVHIL